MVLPECEPVCNLRNLSHITPLPQTCPIKVWIFTVECSRLQNIGRRRLIVKFRSFLKPDHLGLFCFLGHRRACGGRVVTVCDHAYMVIVSARFYTNSFDELIFYPYFFKMLLLIHNNTLTCAFYYLLEL